LAVTISWGLWIPLFVAFPSATSVVMIPGAFGPALAAVAVLRSQGKSARTWVADGVDPQISKRWYGVALGLPLGLAVVLGIGLVIGLGELSTDRLPRAVAMYPVLVVVLSVLGGGQEEFGWRGFALPRLQNRYGALTASVIIGVVWAGWHVPAFVFEIPGYTGSFALYTLLVVGVSIILTWLYNRTDGNVLLAMLFHGGINAAPSVGVAFVSESSTAAVSPYPILVTAVWLVALVLVFRYGHESFGTSPSRTMRRVGLTFGNRR
jgi:membrane protease YdiL (CAAX protease family)